MREWGPIGIADNPGAADEYDSYVGTVYVMLMVHRASEEEISAYVFDIATGHMELSNHSFLTERCAPAAEILIETGPEFKTH